MVNDGNSGQPESSNGNDNGSPVNDGSGSSVGRRPFIKAAGTGAAAAGLAGCLGGGGGSKTIKIGVLAPKASPIGKSIFNSAKLAANEIGKINGKSVEVITKDTKDNPSTAKKKYQELTTGAQVDTTMGIFGSEQLLTIMDPMAQTKTLHLGTGAATPEATRKVARNYDKYKYFFRVGPTNSVFLGESLVEFAKDRFSSMGWEDVYVLAEDYKWTTPVTEVLKSDLASEAGVNVINTKRVASGTKDFTPIYDEIQNTGADGVYTVLAHLGSTSMVQWAKQTRPFGFGGINVISQLPSIYEATKGASRYAFSQTSATATAAITDKTKPYANAYQKQYDALPVYTGYHTYDAMYMFKRAVEGAGGTDTGKLIDQLEKMVYTGTVGDVAFYGKDKKYPHDVKQGPDFFQGVYFQWQKVNGEGQQQVIWPDDVATSSYKTPPWIQG
ncbi:MAG: ABC transporter substrate-binding protein [Halorientalis sp.]